MKSKIVEISSEAASLATPTRILLATDLTDGDYLIPFVVCQAIRTGRSHTHITAVHAILPANVYPGEVTLYPDQTKLDAERRLMLLGIAEQIQAHGISCDVLLKHGFAADVICEAITETGSTRLVMATHGRGKFGQLVLGSVANTLIGRVSIPIFAVGPKVAANSDHLIPKRILCPISLSADSKRTVEIAAGLAHAHGAELTLLHVLDEDFDDEEAPKRRLDRAERAMMALVPEPGTALSVRYMVKYGAVDETVLATAAEIKADWLVIGVDNALISPPLINTNAYRLLAAAECPVIVIRHAPSKKDRENGHDKRRVAVKA
jgi:nucleotide-binding universal stress UspA family protein